MEQTKALNALAPFLALSKSASSPRAAADLVERATSAPNAFIFSELLQTPQIQNLANHPDYCAHLTLLQIFSYGTISDYRKAATSLPTLNAAQTTKLRQLTFLTLAGHPKNLSYAILQQELGLETQRQLEDLVISIFYAGLVGGALDPYHQNVVVTSIAPLRDVPPNSIPAMLSTLDEWSQRCTSTLLDLERRIAGIKAEAGKKHKEEAAWTLEVDKLLDMKDKEDNEKSGGLDEMKAKLSMSGQSKRGPRRLDHDNDELMDLDDEDEVEKLASRSAKKRAGR